MNQDIRSSWHRVWKCSHSLCGKLYTNEVVDDFHDNEYRENYWPRQSMRSNLKVSIYKT